ncbi:hypothetical protein F3Y22_tig00111783pilonHSYRG00040 [Hibiscus syriacus]|uniref:Uncharacterized protein n=1 Tax=Hibiscus syriacus TaxID=106335 RepID=A0A6A2Y0C2_HIBSY|nr:hypothetical protein F3Y22_tig00111783pilonHSYRG00040 [Hibiscus syriacus]
MNKVGAVFSWRQPVAFAAGSRRVKRQGIEQVSFRSDFKIRKVFAAVDNSLAGRAQGEGGPQAAAYYKMLFVSMI